MMCLHVRQRHKQTSRHTESIVTCYKWEAKNYRLKNSAFFSFFSNLICLVVFLPLWKGEFIKLVSTLLFRDVQRLCGRKYYICGKELCENYILRLIWFLLRMSTERTRVVVSSVKRWPMVFGLREFFDVKMEVILQRCSAEHDIQSIFNCPFFLHV